MIWNEELSASLDQSGGVVVFHRIELSRTQQLAQTIAEKVGAMVDQNEKALDIKMGGTGGWGDRTDGNKGEKRGEQTQERRGRGERTRGARGMLPFSLHMRYRPISPPLRWSTRRTWGSFFSRTWQSNARTGDTAGRIICTIRVYHRSILIRIPSVFHSSFYMLRVHKVGSVSFKRSGAQSIIQ